MRKEVIMFNPFSSFGFNKGNVINSGGIPVLRTVSVTTDTTNEVVNYRICPKLFRQMPSHGLFLLHVVNAPTGTTTGFTVNLNGGCVPTIVTATSTTTTSARPLLNGSGTAVTSQEIKLPNCYLIYYNKCDGTFQLVNHIVTTTT